MTVEELIGVYIEASNAVVWEAEKRGLCPMTLDMQRAGVTAIVRALRDEFGRIMEPSDDWNRMGVVDVFNDILLGDAGEKVGTHGSPELDEDARKLEAMGQDPGMTIEEFLDEHFRPPATDAAPAVCEWRGSKDGQLAYMGCTKRLEWTYDRRKCPTCGKPIRFTEAK